ncbi:MAG: hypothetical protein OXD31_10605 [Chloroflexi bacterium]|nr:hypothetical protein [Chloroflexota bacterium]
MNDPHVEALIYEVVHDESSDYSRANCVETEYAAFRLRLEEKEAYFELKEHFPTLKQAQEVIQPFISQWELTASLELGPNTFALRFMRPVIVDRRPEQGVITASASPIRLNIALSSPSVTVFRQYPNPPPERLMQLDNPDVQSMLNRFIGYRQGREPLPSMAYFCFEVFTRRLATNAKHAADKHRMSHKLVKRVSNLASNKGGDLARHHSGICQPLTQQETRFIEKAVVTMIVRAAIVAAEPDQPLEIIHGNNLLETSP